VDARGLASTLGLRRVWLLNDLQATAYAIPHLTGHDLVTINAGEPQEGGAIAVIAPGTGLGEAFLVYTDEGYSAYASEGGHADFGPNDATQLALLGYLFERFDHVGYERVASGIGIPNIYDFFRDTGHAPESPTLAAELAEADDRTPLISRAAQDPDNPDPLAAATLEMFVSILGAEAGNLALKVLSTGGVYLGGGIPPRILAKLKEPGFMQAFTNKGRFGEMLGRMPVYVILIPAALIGAASYGLAHMKHP
jgi:glucokinase